MGELVLRCTGYPAFEDERLMWTFKEVNVNVAYIIGDMTPGAFDLADREVSIIDYWIATLCLIPLT